MDWLIYAVLAIAVALAGLFVLRTYRKQKRETTDDIYPMW